MELRKFCTYKVWYGMVSMENQARGLLEVPPAGFYLSTLTSNGPTLLPPSFSYLTHLDRIDDPDPPSYLGR